MMVLLEQDQVLGGQKMLPKSDRRQFQEPKRLGRELATGSVNFVRA
jgi:hypothetical protein